MDNKDTSENIKKLMSEMAKNLEGKECSDADYEIVSALIGYVVFLSEQIKELHEKIDNISEKERPTHRTDIVSDKYPLKLVSKIKLNTENNEER